MNITLHLRDHLRRAADGDNMLTFEASVDVDHLFETAFIPDECALDVRDLLAEQRAIALIWDAEQVRSHYPHLTRDQAWAVLQECERNYKGEEGLCWDDIGDAVATMYPDPDGFLVPDRVLRVERALTEYTDSDEIANLTDLIADAMHWCRHKGHAFETLQRTASIHFDHETTQA